MSSSFKLTTTLNPGPGEDERRCVGHVLAMLCVDNEIWFRDMAANGLEVPCCAGCVGVKYRPPPKWQHNAGDVRFYCAQDLLERGHGDCGSIAAFDAAVERVRNGVDAHPKIVPGPWGNGSYHAIVTSPQGDHDPTLAMEKG